MLTFNSLRSASSLTDQTRVLGTKQSSLDDLTQDENIIFNYPS